MSAKPQKHREQADIFYLQKMLSVYCSKTIPIQQMVLVCIYKKSFQPNLVMHFWYFHICKTFP